MERVYAKAWKLLKERIKTKTGWGKNELAAAMVECLEQALDEQALDDIPNRLLKEND